MGKRVMRQKTELADYPHKVQQLSCPWTRKEKNEYHHGDFYYGNQGTDVTLHHHLPPPKHSYDPKLLNVPAPYFGREGCDVTEWQRYISGMNPPTEDYYFGIRETDISGHLKPSVPALDNPMNDIFWGRPKTYVTDPSVSPTLTPPARPLDGKGTHAAMAWPAKSQDDQVPLGKSMSKHQSTIRALERSQAAGAPPKPKPRPPRSTSDGQTKKRFSPGQPIGRPNKEFHAPPSLKIKIPKDTDGLYWGRTKSYITDYAVSPTLTPPARPFDGEGARHAMTFVPITPQVDDKIPLGKAVSRMGRSPPMTAGPLKLESPKFRPQTAKRSKDGKCKPCAPPSGGSSPASSGNKSPAGICGGPPSPPASSQPCSRASSASSGGRGKPAPKNKSCKQLAAESKARKEDNIRWRDQISSAKTSESRLESPCCDKKKPRSIPRRPALADIKLPNAYAGTIRRPGATPQKKLAQGLHAKLGSGKILDPHHDQEWHGRAKCYVTDYSVSPNLTPPKRQSFRTAQEKAESMARMLAKRPPKVPPPPPKPPMYQKPPPPVLAQCEARLHMS